MELILASSSPQRKQILREMGVRFRAMSADIDEHHDGLVRPHAIVKSLALRKAERISDGYPKAWVLGCDTLIVLSNGEIALKPKNRADAKRTLLLYRNSHCDVVSGLALMNRAKGVSRVRYEKTRLWFREFTEADVERYLDTGEWKGCSGSMTIEGRAGEWIVRRKGGYWNVVGLPVDLARWFLISAGHVVRGRQVAGWPAPKKIPEPPIFKSDNK